MDRSKWIERVFTFDFPIGWLPNILERLRGTSVRLIAMTNGIAWDTTEYKAGSTWSIKEHIGHLADLEELHEGRIEDFIAGNKVLRAADMQNAKTNQANHNERDINLLIAEFVEKRKRLIARLESLPESTQKATALHPRLLVPMCPVDMAFFTAEHDDHHLATIRELLNK